MHVYYVCLFVCIYVCKKTKLTARPARGKRKREEDDASDYKGEEEEEDEEEELSSADSDARSVSKETYYIWQKRPITYGC